MTSWLYITQSVPWIVAGLLVGFFMGRSTVAVEAIADVVQHEAVSMSGTDKDSRDRPHRSRFTTIHVVAAVVVLLGIFTAVQSYVQGEATARLTECQTAYANGFADALDARSAATSDAQDALDDLLSTVAALTPTPEGREAFVDALDEYLSKRADAKKAQAEHPYPPAPRDVCKETG